MPCCGLLLDDDAEAEVVYHILVLASLSKIPIEASAKIGLFIKRDRYQLIRGAKSAGKIEGGGGLPSRACLRTVEGLTP